MCSETTMLRLKKNLCHQEAEIQRLTKKLDDVCDELVESKNQIDCVRAKIELVRIEFLNF